MLSILPSQRGNSELCRDAVACDGPLPLPIPPLPPSPSCPPLLCRTLSPRCVLAALLLAPSDAPRCTTAMQHRLARRRRIGIVIRVGSSSSPCEFKCRARATSLFARASADRIAAGGVAFGRAAASSSPSVGPKCPSRRHDDWGGLFLLRRVDRDQDPSLSSVCRKVRRFSGKQKASCDARRVFSIYPDGNLMKNRG